jgi:thymidine phosphorylase
LEQKALHLASKVIEMVGMAKWKAAEKLAYGQLISGKAWTMMQQIIKEQHGDPKVTSEWLELASIQKDILATKSWKISHIDMKAVNVAARTLGSPLDLQAWLYLHKKLGDTIKKWEVLYTMYANDESKIRLTKEFLEDKKMYIIK